MKIYLASGIRRIFHVMLKQRAVGINGNLRPYFHSIIGGGYNLDNSDKRIYLAGNDGYHKSDNFLKEATEKMRIYLAGEGIHSYDEFLNEAQQKMVTDIKSFKDFNILESYWDLQSNERTMELLVNCGSYLIDSGAFTFLKAKRDSICDWDDYIERYADFINRWKVEKFFELDIDSIVGIKEVERLRKKLEKLTNRQSIPVWHFSRGKDYYLKMCEEYSYIAFGGLITDGIPYKKIEYVFPWFIEQAHKRNAKLHALGYSSIPGLHKYKFDSIDSTAWLTGNRAGFIYKFLPESGTMEKIKVKENQRLKARAAALNNFVEWVKFNKYAEKFL